MKIETDTSEIGHGDTIGIKTTENGNDVVYVGRINTVEMHDVVDVGFTTDGEYEVFSSDSNNRWVRRFENSNYQSYMRATVTNNGKIKIEGL